MLEEIKRKYKIVDEKELSGLLDMASDQVKRNLDVYGDRFPDACSEGGVYQKTENDDWTNGFWTGMNWLAYEWTGDRVFLEAGMQQMHSFRRRLKDHVVLDHHDMGFLFSPSCVAAYKLVGSTEAKEAAVEAADLLLKRFQSKGRFFQAWGMIGEEKEYRYIIDSMINMPLLFWASEVTGDDIYRKLALEHLDTVKSHSIRPDMSVYHAYYFDPRTGEASHGATHQGNRPESVWARGQAWAVYGAALAYTCTKDEVYHSLFLKMAAYFIERLPSDGVPYWDFDFTDGSTEPRDSSALAIVVCGFFEMADILNSEEYREIALCLLRPLVDLCVKDKNGDGAGILCHGTYAKSSADNGCEDAGVDEFNLWGDYYFMEALTRGIKKWNSYWTP